MVRCTDPVLLAPPGGSASASALSIDGGAWQWQNPLPQGTGYTNGYFLDADHGWLVSGGTIYHTTDGGLTLTVQARHNVDFTAITFCGAGHGWATGYPAGHRGTAILYRTVNGGATWARVPLRWPGGIRGLSFATTQVGWATVEQSILHTTDGGRSWTGQVSVRHEKLFAVQALSARQAWVAERTNSLLHTVDGGRHWTAVHVAGGAYLTMVAFKGARYGWAAGATNAGSIVHTTDGGRHWAVQLSVGRVTGLSFADRHNGWAIADGQTYRTTDGGGVWQLQANAPDSTWVDDLTAGTAFIGAPAGFTTGGLSATTDGGATWQPGVSAAGGYYGDLSALQFSDAQHGWAVGGGGEILATANGGATWAAQSSTTTGISTVLPSPTPRTAGRSATTARSCTPPTAVPPGRRRAQARATSSPALPSPTPRTAGPPARVPPGRLRQRPHPAHHRRRSALDDAVRSRPMSRTP